MIRELIRDLKSAAEHPYFRWKLEPFGIVGWGRPDSSVPRIGEPTLLYFPPPYHALEVLAACRGWAGVNHGDPERPVEGARAVHRVRNLPSWYDAIRELGAVLFLTPEDSVRAAHLLQPISRLGGDDRGTYAARREVYAALGFTQIDACAVEVATKIGGPYEQRVPETDGIKFVY